MSSGSLVLPALLAGLLHAAGALAADASIRIDEPADGAKLDSMKEAKLVYEVVPASGGDHVHVYVDDKEVGILRKLSGQYTLETLQPGRRQICIKIVNKAHAPTGQQKCVTVTVE